MKNYLSPEIEIDKLLTVDILSVSDTNGKDNIGDLDDWNND